MDIPTLTDDSLKTLHNAIRDCLEIDEAIPSGQDKKYGVRQFPDWKKMADEMEAELDKRGKTYTPIPW
ncbi:MAG: hypothetical protein ACYYKD_11545 [Rhodospirillales bacterium]